MALLIMALLILITRLYRGNNNRVLVLYATGVTFQYFVPGTRYVSGTAVYTVRVLEGNIDAQACYDPRSYCCGIVIQREGREPVCCCC